MVPNCSEMKISFNPKKNHFCAPKENKKIEDFEMPNLTTKKTLHIEPDNTLFSAVIERYLSSFETIFLIKCELFSFKDSFDFCFDEMNVFCDFFSGNFSTKRFLVDSFVIRLSLDYPLKPASFHFDFSLKSDTEKRERFISLYEKSEEKSITKLLSLWIKCFE